MFILVRVEIKTLVCEKLTADLQKGLHKNSSLFCLETQRSAISPLHGGTSTGCVSQEVMYLFKHPLP